MRRKNLRILFFIVCLNFVFAVLVSAQTSAFNFQGRLNDGGTAANGNYDLRFKLFDAITGGTDLGSIDRLNLQVINGVFSTALDFGPLAFQNVGNRFIEISVRPAGSPNAFVVLGARQQILAVPYSVRAINSTNAENATNATNATTAQNSLSLGGVVASGYVKLNTANTGELITDGNIRQTINAGGAIKAMLVVDSISDTTTNILRCYNGITGASTGNCGFTVSSSMDGVYQINFGFPVNQRFVSAIGRYGSFHGPGSSGFNVGINYQFPSTNPTVIEFFTFATGNSNDTVWADFTVIVY